MKEHGNHKNDVVREPLLIYNLLDDVSRNQSALQVSFWSNVSQFLCATFNRPIPLRLLCERKHFPILTDDKYVFE